MDGQRQRSGRRRRRKKGANGSNGKTEPVVVAARRPNSPVIIQTRKSAVAASATPDGPKSNGSRRPEDERDKGANGRSNGAERHKPRRSARIVSLPSRDEDARELLRKRLLERLMLSETRGAISRAANEYLEEGFDFPEEQEVQLQLLEHFDEDRAREAIACLSGILEEEDPIKRPILERRLKRIEEYADEAATRTAAADLLRATR